MRRKLLMLLAIGIGMTSSVWALEKDANGVYQISTKQDLFDFASKVNNNNEASANAVLTKNIDLDNNAWTPIGNATTPYTGTFDGGGYTISKLSLSTSSDRSGFFGQIGDGAVVMNFTIDGSITSNKHQYVGGVIGAAGSGNGTVTISHIHSKVNITCSKTRHGGILGWQSSVGTINIDHCTYSGILTVTGNVTGNFGGIVGFTQTNANAKFNITNCLFDGTIDDGTGDNAGGIVGYTNSTQVIITNCLSIGNITADKPGQFFGQLNGKNSKCNGKNYYLSDSVVGNLKEGVSLKGTTPETVTTDRLKSGEICYLLNGSTNGSNWYQTKGTDDYPIPNNKHKKVFKYKSSYINDGANIEIDNATDLINFATIVNDGAYTTNATLTADITLTKDTWTEPIGNWVVVDGTNNAYKGHFNGRGYTINNLTYTTGRNYHGLFGVISTGALIENFSINGTITSKHGTIGVVSFARDEEPIIRNIHSHLNINNERAGSRLGGILGTIQGGKENSYKATVTIERCTYSGIMDGNDNANNGNYGGIVGYTYNGGNTNLKIIDCIFDGSLINTAENPGNCTFGGMVGYVGANPNVTVTNCLSIGTLQSKIIGQFYGAVKHNTCSIINSYYKEGTNINGDVSDAVTPTIMEVTPVTNSQLENGEVTYKLGSAFYQTIAPKSRPTLDNTHGIVKKISDAKFATTYFSGTDVTIPEDVTAYAAAVNDGKVVLSAIEDKIAYGDAVVLNGEEGYYSFVPTTGASKAANNDLKISDGNVATDASNNVYALAKNGTKVGFRIVGNGVKIPAGKAYLQVAAGAGVKEFYPFGEEETGLTPTFSEGEGAVYDLSGRLVNSLKKGIYIANGKKVLF